MSNKEEEIWKDITEYEGIYMISNKGRVKSMHTRLSDVEKIGIILTPVKRGGYDRVSLQKKGAIKWKAVHRLIMTAFVPNPNNLPIINHINGIRDDNSLTNLEWCTQSRNVSHAFETGLKISAKGTRHGMCKLSENNVLEIRKLIADGKNNKEIGDLFNVSNTHIGYIKSGKLWSHL